MKASGMFSPCVILPLLGLNATNPPSGAGVRTAVKVITADTVTAIN
jgi:hypothetical protein